MVLGQLIILHVKFPYKIVSQYTRNYDFNFSQLNEYKLQPVDLTETDFDKCMMDARYSLDV